MKIKVTKEDIENGEPGNSEECAISLALQRHYNTNNTFVSGAFDKDEPDIRVDDIPLKVCEKDIYNVGSFINLFDDYILYDDGSFRGDETCIPQPFEFEIMEGK